jgi:hypothetical protein
MTLDFLDFSLQSLVITINLQQLTINDYLRLAQFCWTATVLSSTVTDLVLIYEPLTRGFRRNYEWRMTTHQRMNPESLLTYDWTVNSLTNEWSHFKSESKSHCDWRSVSQYVLVSSPIWGSLADICYCLTVTVLFLLGPLSDERKGLFCICCGPLLAQSFSGPSSLGLATIFYCLRFETFLFVASYDSQGPCGGFRPRLHTGQVTLRLCLPFITSGRTEYKSPPPAVLLYSVLIRCCGNVR